MRRRPRDRRDRIVEVAGGLFLDRGYRQVGMADVAAGVEIGASALYRHFRGKSDLLVAVLDAALDRLEAATAGVGEPERLLAAMAGVQMTSREYPALWERERDELPADAHERLAARRDRLDRLLLDAVRGDPEPGNAGRRGDLGTDTGAAPDGAATGAADAAVEVRVLAASAVVLSPSYHHLRIEPERGVALLGAAAARCLAADPPLPDPERASADDRAPGPAGPAGAAGPAGPAGPAGAAVELSLLPAARGEALVAVAGRLFAERGYHAVSLGEIGAAAGIAGPSIYNHFPSKVDLLTAILQRGSEVLWFTLHQALAGAADPGQALRLMLDGYIGVLTARPGVVPILLDEIASLSPEPRRRLRTTQQRYVTEWVALLRAWRPDLAEPDARLLVHAAFAVANSLTRQAASGRGPTAGIPSPWVRALAGAALGLPSELVVD
ncbi:MAG TPA: helix-turn-helix domain-containing protein [Pseudonocardia sp.]|nr:helix-turn-helix domain-containing protein [Pseudonocardia sp.]